MQMGVVREILPPSVQDRSKAKLSAEIFFVGGEFPQGFSGSLEQQVIHQGLILIKDRAQLLRHSEHDMEIAGIEQILFLFLNPTLFGESLALRAVAVAAGVVGNLGNTAVGAGVDMRTQFGGTAL